jgi:hypothetical protein
MKDTVMSLTIKTPNRTHLQKSLKAAAVCICFTALPPHLYAEDVASAKPGDFNAAVMAVKSEEFAIAFDLFEKLAQDGNHDAQFNLAVLLRNGQGRPQHFTKALEWALLAQLGGVSQAKNLSDKLGALVTEDSFAKCIENVDAHLMDRLARGERRAVIQYVIYNQSILPTPNLETAYLWSLIGAAIGIPNANLLRDNIFTELDSTTIEVTQETARTLFEEQNMTELFSSSSG